MSTAEHYLKMAIDLARQNAEQGGRPFGCVIVKDGNVVVRADVPGLDPKDIEVSVLGNVLMIKGERKEEQEVKKENYFRREVSYGAFERHITLPEGAQTDKIKATFKNGVVEVTMPIAKEAGAKKIPLEAAH